MSGELRMIKVPEDAELLARAQELHLDVPRLMAAALGERIAATRTFRGALSANVT